MLDASIRRQVSAARPRAVRCRHRADPDTRSTSPSCGATVSSPPERAGPAVRHGARAAPGHDPARDRDAVDAGRRAGTPPAGSKTLEPGDEIVVVGRVRRRFFRAGGATASRVELEADVVARGPRPPPGACGPRRAWRPRWNRSMSENGVACRARPTPELPRWWRYSGSPAADWGSGALARGDRCVSHAGARRTNRLEMRKA